MENEFLASGGEWKKIFLEDVFYIQTSRSLNKGELILCSKEQSDIEFVGRSQINNGVQGYLQELDFEPNASNTFSVIQIGENVAQFRKNRWYASQNIFLLKPRQGFAKFINSHEFITACINKGLRKFSGGYSSYPTLQTLKSLEIQLPYINSDIAFDYMENYMRELQKERLRELQLYLKITGLSSYELTDDEINVMGRGNIHWNNYRIGDLFDTIKQGTRLTKQDQTDGDLMFVMSGTTNTGIAGKIGNSKNQFPKNSLTIDIFGNVFYRNYEFGASDDVGVYYNSNKQIDKMSMLYLATSIQKNLIGKYDYGYKLRASKSYDLICQLPTKNNQIDFDYMTTYIKAIQKLIIKDLVLYAKRELKAYEQVIVSN